MKKFLILPLFTLLLSCNSVNNIATNNRVTPEIKAWEPDIIRFEQLDRSEIYPPDAIMFAGSSSIRLWSTLARDMEPYPVIQRGYGGAKLSDFAYYAHRIFDPHQCRAFVIFVANDITGNSDDKTPEQVDSLCNRVIDIIRSKHPDTPVFWIATTPTSSRWAVWPEISQANDLIRQTCENRKNTWFISTDTVYLNDQGRPDDSLFRNDRLHLNDNGYAKWTRIIKDQLNKVLANQ